jgi:hypothetical protein
VYRGHGCQAPHILTLIVSAILTVRNDGVWRAERERTQQATEANWLTRERDNRCAESLKTRPLSYEAVTLYGGDRSALGSDGLTQEKERLKSMGTRLDGLLSSCGN